MGRWTVGQVIEATGGRLLAGDASLSLNGIALDSRSLLPGQAFLAIRGPRFDAHDFLPDVSRRGARCLIVEQPPASRQIPIVRVPNSVEALGRLAAFHRARFDGPVIAVTGSCGKTTTKELIASLLADSHRLVKTHLTENNHIGLPQTLLKLTTEETAAVVELGSNHPGEIAYLARIASPTVAVITNVGPAHLEFFGSIEGVIREKLSLLASLRPGGVAVVPGDQLEVVLEAKRRLPAGCAMITFGVSGQCGLQGVDLRACDGGWSFRVRGSPSVFELSVPGSHQLENALAALACLKALGVPLESAQPALRAFRPLLMRSELIHCGSVTVISDCYNANPLSFARALETLRDLEVKRRVVCAGDMLELGEHAPSAHRAIGRLAAECGVELLVAVGTFAHEFARGAAELQGIRVQTYDTVEALLSKLPSLIHEGDGWLVKGSRRLKLEQIVASVRAHCEAMDEPAVAAASSWATASQDAAKR